MCKIKAFGFFRSRLSYYITVSQSVSVSCLFFQKVMIIMCTLFFFSEISDFLGAANLGEVLSYLTTNPSSERDAREPLFTPEPMRNEHKQQVIE